MTKESFIFNFFKSLFVYQNNNILLSQQIIQIDKKKSLIVLFYYTNHPPRTKFRRCIGITSTVRLFFCAIVSNLYLSYQWKFEVPHSLSLTSGCVLILDPSAFGHVQGQKKEKFIIRVRSISSLLRNIWRSYFTQRLRMCHNYD